MAFGLSAGAAALIGAVAAPVIGGIIGSGASKDASGAQVQAAGQADATQRYQYDTTRADNAPFRATGLDANNKLAYLMGLGGGGGTSPMTRDQIRAQLQPKYTTTTPGATSGFMPIDYDTSKYGPWEGGSTPGTQNVDQNGLNSAVEAQFQQQPQPTPNNDPAYGSLSRKFSTSDLNADPVYQNGLQFGLEQGQDGINRQAAAGGSMLSGATLKALTRFGNDYGSTKANESYNRFNTDQNQQYNRLAGLSGAGQQATNQVSVAGQNMANNVSQNQIGAGNARASGYIGGANALSGALSGGYNNYQNNRLYNSFINKNNGSGSAYSYPGIPSNNDAYIPMQPGGGY